MESSWHQGVIRKNKSQDAPSICFAGRENVVDWDFTLNELVPGEPLTAPVQALRCDGHQHAGQHLALPANSASACHHEMHQILQTVQLCTHASSSACLQTHVCRYGMLNDCGLCITGAICLELYDRSSGAKICDSCPQLGSLPSRHLLLPVYV